MSSAINAPIMPSAHRSLLWMVWCTKNDGMYQGKALIVGWKSLYQAQADDMLSTAKGCTSNAPRKGRNVYKRCGEKRITYLWPRGVLQKCQEGRREGLCVRHLCANKNPLATKTKRGKGGAPPMEPKSFRLPFFYNTTTFNKAPGTRTWVSAYPLYNIALKSVCDIQSMFDPHIFLLVSHDDTSSMWIPCDFSNGPMATHL